MLHFRKKKLVSIIIGLEEEDTLLNSKLENMKKYICRLNNGWDMLDEILEVGKMSKNMKAIGFDYNFMNKEVEIPTKKFVPQMKKNQFLMLWTICHNIRFDMCILNT